MWQWIAAVTALALFAVGVFAFLWAYCNAVQRSRTDAIAVSGLYLLLGPPTPTPRAPASCSGRCSLQLVDRRWSRRWPALDGPDGRPGTSLALGFLVPMFGFGLNGLWAAYHGRLPEPRTLRGSIGGRDRMSAMAETASETIQIAAPPERVWEIAADVERYPDWVRDVKDVVVRSRDEQQRPSEVEFRASALGRSTHYTLATTTRRRPTCWPGRWSAATSCARSRAPTTSAPTADGGTEVRYDLAIELVVPLPGFVKRRAEVRILNTVRELKTRAEA